MAHDHRMNPVGEPHLNKIHRHEVRVAPNAHMVVHSSRPYLTRAEKEKAFDDYDNREREDRTWGGHEPRGE